VPSSGARASLPPLARLRQLCTQADGLVHRAVPPGVSGEGRTSTMRPSPRAEEPRHILRPVPHPFPKMLGQREDDGRHHLSGECRGQQLPHGAQHGVHPLPARLITPRPHRDRYGDEAFSSALIPPGREDFLARDALRVESGAPLRQVRKGQGRARNLMHCGTTYP
jgi:hypothetical protein